MQLEARYGIQMTTEIHGDKTQGNNFWVFLGTGLAQAHGHWVFIQQTQLSFI
jgi:hypothetical protein